MLSQSVTATASTVLDISVVELLQCIVQESRSLQEHSIVSEQMLVKSLVVGVLLELLVVRDLLVG